MHRHRPGTTRPVVRKQRDAIRAKQQRKAMRLSITVGVIIVIFIITTHMRPKPLNATVSWLAWLWLSLFGPTAG